MTYNYKLYENALRDTFNVDFDEACLSKVILPDNAIEKIINWLATPANLLIFCGNPGVGKTFLCVSIGKFLIEKNKEFRCFNEISYFSHLREKVGENIDSSREIKRLCEVEYLILDDIGSSEGFTPWQKDQLFSLIDHRASSRKPTIITSNIFTINMDKIFSQRFISRLKDKRNTLMEFNWIDKRQEEF